MKVAKFIVALLLTFVLLYIAQTNSRGRPEFLSHSEGGYTFEMTTVPKITEYQSDSLRLTIDGPIGPGDRVVYRTTGHPGLDTVPFEKYTTGSAAYDTAAGEYFALVEAGPRGQREYYVFEVIDSTGATLARFTKDEGRPFLLRYIGEVPSYILIPHIIFMFVTVFCLAYGSVNSVYVISGRQSVHSMAIWYFWAMAATFLGGYIFGPPMNYYAFDGFWEGVPFGTDATDNKTQLLFVYLLFVVAASLGSLTRGKFGRDAFRPRVLGWFGFLGFFVMLGIYLIPHSIQFSPALTHAVCYSFIGLFLVVYLIGYFTPRNTETTAT